MKKQILLLCSLALVLAHSAFAQITVTAVPSSQTVASGGTFTLQLNLNVVQSNNPANITGFDVVFEGQGTQNGTSISGFQVTNYAAPASRPDWQRVAFGNDAFGSLTTDHSGFLQTQDEGASGNGSGTATPLSNFSLGTWTFAVPTGLAPGTTWTFDTSVLATSASHFSDMSSTQNGPNGGNFAFSNSATFSVTIVPEPATWSLMGLGSLGLFGINLLRRKYQS